MKLEYEDQTTNEANVRISQHLSRDAIVVVVEGLNTEWHLSWYLKKRDKGNKKGQNHKILL